MNSNQSQNVPLQTTSADRDKDLPLSRVVILLAVASLAGAVVISLDTLRDRSFLSVRRAPVAGPPPLVFPSCGVAP